MVSEFSIINENGRTVCSVTSDPKVAHLLEIKNDHLVLGSRRVPLRIRQGRPGAIRLGVAEDHVWLQTGTATLEPRAVDFLHSKAKWLARIVPTVQGGASERTRLRAALPNTARLFGQDVPVAITPGAKLYYKYTGGTLHLHLTPRLNSRAAQCIRPVLQQIAKQYLVRRTQELAEYASLHVNQVRIKDHRSKWGSCSSLRNINLNWHLVLLDKHLADYVIMHELMHLHEMNHGARFWSLVGQHLPDYRQCIHQIRAQEWILGCYD